MINKITKASTRKRLKAHGVKFSKWAEAYLNPKSKTHGNATQSALKHYNCKNYGVASVIASQNLKKLPSIGLTLSETSGVSVADWFKIASTKAIKGTYEQTIDYMQIIGILEKDINGPHNQVNQQFNLGNIAKSFAQARKERGLD